MNFWRLDVLQDPVAYPTGCMVLEPISPEAVAALPVHQLVRDSWANGTLSWWQTPDGGWIIPAVDYSDALWLAADCLSCHLANQRRRVRYDRDR